MLQEDEGYYENWEVEAAPEVKTQTLVSLLDQLHRAGAQKVSMTGVLP